MIEVVGLGKQFRELTAVHDLSFSVGDGEIFGLLGPNGAGKTTTIRMLSALIAPSAGSVRINGNGLDDAPQRIRAITGILTESPGLHDRLTARQNLAYYGRLYGLGGGALRRAVERYLSIVGMDGAADRRVAGFSKGMRQKVAIARALLHEPEVLYLDEPTIGLDVVAKHRVRSFLRELNQERGVTVLLTTHDMSDVERLCSRLVIVDHGRLLYDGGLEDMRARVDDDSTLEDMMRQFYERTSRELLAELEAEMMPAGLA